MTNVKKWTNSYKSNIFPKTKQVYGLLDRLISFAVFQPIPHNSKRWFHLISTVYSLGQRGIVFVFPYYHIHSPSFLYRSRFYGFIFPSWFWVGKKNPSANLDLIPKCPKYGEKSKPVWDWFRLYLDTVFFPVISWGKKKNRKIIPFLSIFLDDWQFCMW